MMKLLDVNVLVYAYRQESQASDQYAQYLEDLINSEESFALSELVLSAFLRIVTHPKIFKPPSPLKDALKFLKPIIKLPQVQLLRPGLRHWELFLELCQKTKAKGNLIPDAYFAAIAIEQNCEWISSDKDYKKFPGLKWSLPLKGASNQI